jgi:hypothetical protein
MELHHSCCQCDRDLELLETLAREHKLIWSTLGPVTDRFKTGIAKLQLNFFDLDKCEKIWKNNVMTPFRRFTWKEYAMLSLQNEYAKVLQRLRDGPRHASPELSGQMVFKRHLKAGIWPLRLQDYFIAVRRIRRITLVAEAKKLYSVAEVLRHGTDSMLFRRIYLLQPIPLTITPEVLAQRDQFRETRTEEIARIHRAVEKTLKCYDVPDLLLIHSTSV